MQAERWQRVKEIFHAALDLPPEERTNYLRSACGDDAELRAEAESLLKSSEEAGEFLEPGGSAAPEKHEAPGGWTGRQAGAYRILEKIGQGGMGVVYRAEDQRLARVAALKFLSEDQERDPQARERFEREARAASALNHPNICTIYGVDEYQGHPYLAMELLTGETLNHAIGRGPLDAKRIVEIGIAVTEALEAAHREGIIHRDIKPSNIILSERGQVKVLDFGLAKQTAHPSADDTTHTLHDSFAGTLTMPGMAVGTVSYMSPEQARGEKLDARTDLYSLGAVLYECATGHKAFPGRTPVLVYDAILNRAPAPMRELHRGVDRRLEPVVLKLLEKKREARYQSGAELRRVLEGLRDELRTGSSAERAAAARNETRRASWRTGLGILGGLLLAAAAGYWVVRHKQDMAPPLEVGGLAPARGLTRRSVAVLGFKNLTGRPEQAWLSTAFSEMLSTELAAGGQLRVIPGENVARAKADLSLAEAESYSAETLKKIRKHLGADYVVIGSYYSMGKESGGMIRLDVRVQDLVAGETVASIPETGTEEKLIELLTAAGSDLRAKLGLGDVAATETARAAVTLPSSQAGARYYAEGLEKLRMFEPVAAREALTKAVAAEPRHPLIHAALARAWRDLGADGKAIEEARAAVSLSAGLPQSEGLWVEGQFREATHEWDKAIEIYRTLFGIYPDNIEYGLRLADAQTGAGHANDAMQTIRALRALPAPASEDPRIDLAEGDAEEVSGDFPNEKRLAVRALAGAQSRGARLLGARALYAKAWASLNLGEVAEARKAAEEARAIYVAAGDRNGEANLLRTLGTAQLMEGHLAEAQKYYERSLHISREVGNRYSEAAAFNQMAAVLERQGNRSGALERYQQSLSILGELGNKQAEGTAVNNIANILWARGELSKSRKMYDQALKIAGELGDRHRESGTTVNIAHILFEQGDLRGTEEKLENAISLARGIGEQTVVADATKTLGEVRLAQADFAGARRYLEESLALRTKLGEQGSIAESRLSLAELAFEEGHAAEAQKMLEPAIDEFRKEGLKDLEIAAFGLDARIKLDLGRAAEAARAIESGRALLPKNENPALRWSVEASAGRVQAVNGKARDARKSLEAALAAAGSMGFVHSQFKLRLALGEIEMKAGDALAGRTRLRALEKDATARNFLLVGHQARSLQGN